LCLTDCCCGRTSKLDFIPSCYPLCLKDLSMIVHFLQASVPLTKTYASVNGDIVKTPYPMTWEFTSHKETVSDLRGLEALLKTHAAKGNCILKGNIAKPLVKESRAGSTQTNDATEWLVLDLDGLPEFVDVTTPGGQPVSTPMTIDLFLAEMKLQDISYIVQWSASYGIENKKIRAHVFMLLDKPYSAPLLKQYLIQKNHEVSFLREAMTLTKTGNSISWPLDVSACQNDKLIYIAPPVLKGIKDPMGKLPRISLVKRKYDTLGLASTINTSERNTKLTNDRVNELRDAANLPKRKFSHKIVGQAYVLLKPDECTITEMKTERGYVYFNLNGGDSWAYYHPEDKPDYIHNFKGEPSYLTKELLPDYWSQITSSGNLRTSSSGITYLAFCDRKTGAYWRGTYDNTTDLLDINVAKNETQLRHFALANGVPLSDYVPEWNLVFDPQDSVRVDVVNKTINKFLPSLYMKAQAKKVTKCPPTVFKVLHHALGSDVDITEHFINWIAYVLQKRDRTKTAWVLHGTQGTGKGILTNNILRPIFGAAHTASRRMEELGEKYNQFMAESLLVFVDEVQIKSMQNEKGVMAKLKNFITEEFVPMRQMYSNGVEARNYTNWIFMSNMSDPVMIDKNDRRFNVGVYQPTKLLVTDAELAKIDKELQTFHDYLLSYPLDERKAGEVIHSVDRETMISISESSIDTVASAMLDGKFGFFIDNLPTDNSYQRSALMSSKVEDYRAVLTDILARTAPDGKCNVARDELRIIFDYVVGNIPTSPNKFTSLLKHHRVHTQAVWVNNKTVNGIAVKWNDVGSFNQYVKEHFAPKAQKAKVK
jgi:hypothetical protein